MYKILFYSILLVIIIKADTLNNSFENILIEGYLRSGYEIHNVKDSDIFKDGAVGGKVHIETKSYYGFSLGSSFYSSNALGSSDNRGLVPFRGEVANSYAILGEAYIRFFVKNTYIKIGRQEIDTPFAQIDDIGMVPNTFEAYIFENRDIQNTTIFLGQIQKMAGVDANIVDSFTKINDKNMQTIGITYQGIKNLNCMAWYYYLKDAEINSIGYIEANYENKIYSLNYDFGLQYSKQTNSIEKDSSIYGINTNINHIKSGITLFIAYNKVNNNAITSGFGGGPFFSNSEYLIIDNAGKNGSQLLFGVNFNASSINIDGLTLGLSKVILKNENNKIATEIDFVTSYEVDKNLNFNTVYSNLNGKSLNEDNAKHLRLFMNYNF